MRIGTMTILFREHNDSAEHIGYTESLRRIRGAGFTVADLNLCQICAHKTLLHLDDWRNEAERIRATADELGISLPQCHLPFKSKKVRWKTPEDYEYYIKMFYRAIDTAAFIGIPWGVVHPERCNSLPPEANERKIAANHAEYDALIEYALSRGVNIAFENMIYNPGNGAVYCSDAGELAALTDSFGDPRVGVCWDTGHANTLYRDQWEPLHVIGSRLHCTHIDDNRRTDDLHLLPYEGLINWRQVIAALDDIGYPGDLILETSINYFSPDRLKDENGRHAFAVMSALPEELQ